MLDYLPYISLLIAVIGMYFTSKNSKKDDVKTIEEKAKERAVINTKLDAIAQNVTDIKYDITSTKNDVSVLKTELAKTNESLKSAHKRLDAHDEKISDLEKR